MVRKPSEKVLKDKLRKYFKLYHKEMAVFHDIVKYIGRDLYLNNNDMVKAVIMVSSTRDGDTYADTAAKIISDVWKEADKK